MPRVRAWVSVLPSLAPSLGSGVPPWLGPEEPEPSLGGRAGQELAGGGGGGGLRLALLLLVSGCGAMWRAPLALWGWAWLCGGGAGSGGCEALGCAGPGEGCCRGGNLTHPEARCCRLPFHTFLDNVGWLVRKLSGLLILLVLFAIGYFLQRLICPSPRRRRRERRRAARRRSSEEEEEEEGEEDEEEEEEEEERGCGAGGASSSSFPGTAASSQDSLLDSHGRSHSQGRPLPLLPLPAPACFFHLPAYEEVKHLPSYEESMRHAAVLPVTSLATRRRSLDQAEPRAGGGAGGAGS
ncbi:uncharacterized membrane protein C3orf80 homolog [Anolis carolinensis]|uniref:uncharacterized membrane protein C3orf80 homolog n=1 Tax=Anolis carolinensis TaxID=28377 RepID=UPI002F2B89B1